ncbi:MAG TPA: helix-turn-helix transcriptional regulator [Corynebacteriales bacterium]|nr:helix-turn-helix transcriptional regulator [Mycobacteriales bacterium]
MSTENDNTVPYRWSLPLTIDGKILNAAYEVLTEKGITGATISEIAQRAGVSRPPLPSVQRHGRCHQLTSDIANSRHDEPAVPTCG